MIVKVTVVCLKKKCLTGFVCFYFVEGSALNKEMFEVAHMSSYQNVRVKQSVVHNIKKEEEIFRYK